MEVNIGQLDTLSTRLVNFGDENTISKYVREQGIAKEYNTLYKSIQLTHF